MSTSDITEHTNSANGTNTITLSTLQCEIKLVNNWKKLQLRSRFTFTEIDPIEIKAMMINYYSIYCSLETKLEFYSFTQTYNDIPNINSIISFLKNNETNYKIIDDSPSNDSNNINNDINNNNNNQLLTIQIELPIIVLPIIKNSIERYHFYGFGNGKLLLYYNNEEVNNIFSIRNSKHNNKHGIYYKDILLMFNYNGNTNIYDNYTFGHPKNINFELDLYEECNIYELNELELEIIPKTNGIITANDRCVICLSNILYSYQSYSRISSCKHIYHYECIENLIKFSNDNQCPLCRGKITYIQYLNASINKIFKIKNNTLSIISHKHYFNKYYLSKKNNTNNTINDNENDDQYDEKEEGIIASNQIPPKPCLGFLESMPSPTNSNSSISIPPTRHSSPSTPNITQLTLNNDNNNNNNNNNNNQNNNNGNYNNNNNNNNNGNTTNSKSLGYFDTNFHDKNAGEDY